MTGLNPRAPSEFVRGTLSERRLPLPRCPACGKRVLGNGDAVDVHGHLYHGRCAVYSRR